MKKMFALGLALLSLNAFAVCAPENTVLGANNSLACEDSQSAESVDFSYTSEEDKHLYVSWSMGMGCPDRELSRMEWLTLDSQGDVVSTTDVTRNSFDAKAGARHVLRVQLNAVSECPFYALQFGIEGI